MAGDSSMKKRRIIFVALFVIILFANIIPVFAFHGSVKITKLSIIVLGIMLVEIIYGILCCFCKHKANFFKYYHRIHMFWEDDASTYTTEYLKEFDTYAMIFFSIIPFYIPLIHFTTKPIHTLWMLLLLSFPQIVFIIMGTRDTLKELKEDKI